MTYGIPYTVRGWGDEIVTTVEIPPSDVPSGFSSVVRAGDGPVILVPTSALTPVDTTPPEPEPGAWLIGEKVCIRLIRPIERPWFRETSQGRTFETWADTWAAIGGSGITPRRLVPAPAPVDVKLPWRGSTNFGSNLMISAPDEDGDIEVSLDGAGGIIASANLAEDMAAALLAAARAAREATT